MAALRDTCSLGGCVSADDVEKLADKDADPNLRAMLLASNRRGAYVPLQEPSANGGWQTRYVDAFGVKLFTAIRQPDGTLGSRCIVIPMAGADDDRRANSNEGGDADWPHNLAQIHRDAWLVALSNVAKLAEFDRRVVDDAPVAGRALDPWRAVLAVALWLDECGATGLYATIRAQCVRYQEVRGDLTTPDLTYLVAHALIRMAEGDASDTKGVTYLFKEKIITASQVLDLLPGVVADLDADFDTTKVSADQVGRRLTKLLPNGKARTGKMRGRRLTLRDVQRIARARGIKTPLAHSSDEPLKPSVTSVTSVTNATSSPVGSAIVNFLRTHSPSKTSAAIKAAMDATGATADEAVEHVRQLVS